MSAPKLHPILVADASGIASLVEALRSEPVIALDTESNSFHVYRERVCLIQLSTPGADFVVDPFAVDPRPLGAVLSAGSTVVLHGADYDVRCLKREYGIGLPSLFDTMAAARRLGRPGLGLSALVEQHFGVRLTKDFQRSDWGRRPLSAEQVSYAALDTHYLLRLHALLSTELRARDLEEEVRRECARIAAVEPRPKVFDPEGWRRLKGVRQLDGEGKGVLRELWIAREERARELDRPPFKVMPEHTMIEVARERPRTMQALLRVPGVTQVVLRRMGSAALATLRPPPNGADGDGAGG